MAEQTVPSGTPLALDYSLDADTQLKVEFQTTDGNRTPLLDVTLGPDAGSLDPALVLNQEGVLSAKAFLAQQDTNVRLTLRAHNQFSILKHWANAHTQFNRDYEYSMSIKIASGG